MDSSDALSRSRCRERRLNKPVELIAQLVELHKTENKYSLACIAKRTIHFDLFIDRLIAHWNAPTACRMKWQMLTALIAELKGAMRLV